MVLVYLEVCDMAKGIVGGPRGPLKQELLLAAALAVAVPLWAGGGPAGAQTCGSEYAIKEGESLAQIAARAYGNPAQWTVIFYANQDRLGTNASLLVPGLALRLPCIGGAGTAPAGASGAPVPTGSAAGEQPFVISQMVKRIEFLTADGYSPYTGRTLEGGGMLTQVVTTAMDRIKEEAKGRFDYGLSWVNDWAAHLNPLLITRAFDVGFPWARPDCESAASLDQGSQFRCQKFFFSEPLYEVITSLFVRQDSKITRLRTEEIAGTSLCRPTGYPVHELDQNGRNWVKDGKVTLIRPSTVDECFRLLDNGTVDGVVMNELVGRVSISSLGLGAKVRVIEEPVALTTLHMLVSKTHPQARTILYYANAALGKLKETGDYDRIVERHLNAFWQAQTPAPNPAIGATPATRAPAGGATPAKSGAPAATSTAKNEAPAKPSQ
jgi:polar amino acid transport system substrate-binding protein